MKNVALIYCRVSRDEQAENYSLPDQERICRKYAADNDLRVLDVFYEEGVSGAKADRPQIKKALQMAYDGEYKHFICADIDRFARGGAIQFILERELESAGVEIHYVLNNFEKTPEGALQKNILVAFAEFEREKIKARTTRGRIQRARTGQILPSGTGRYGYDYVREPRAHFAVNEEEAEVVRMIYAWYLEGMGGMKIARKLSEMGIPTKQDKQGGHKKAGRGEWNYGVIYKILTDPIYTGKYFYNKAEWDRKGNRKERPREEWVAIDVPPIIDEETFYKAQQVRARNKKHSRRNTKHEYLLQGIAKCPQGYSYGGRTSYVNGKPYSYYRCNGDHSLRSQQCPACPRGLKVGEIDSLVWSEFCKHIRNPQLILDALNNPQQETNYDILARRIQLAQDEISEISRRKDALLNLYLEGGVDKERYFEKQTELDNKQAHFEQLREETLSQMQAESAAMDENELLRVCEELLPLLDEMNQEERREALMIFNISVTIDVERGEIAISGNFPSLSIDSPSLRCNNRK